MQGFDVIAQTLGHLASVVGSANRGEAIERIGMANLRTRILRRSLDDDGLLAPD